MSTQTVEIALGLQEEFLREKNWDILHYVGETD
jgi:hypothetical protein